MHFRGLLCISIFLHPVQCSFEPLLTHVPLIARRCFAGGRKIKVFLLIARQNYIFFSISLFSSPNPPLFFIFIVILQYVTSIFFSLVASWVPGQHDSLTTCQYCTVHQKTWSGSRIGRKSTNRESDPTIAAALAHRFWSFCATLALTLQFLLFLHRLDLIREQDCGKKLPIPSSLPTACLSDRDK